MLLCPELISYFISKWDIKKAFPEVLHSQVLWNKTTIFTRPGSYSCWKTWSCISSFLLTTRIESWITKKKKSFPKVFQSSFVADLQALVKVQTCYTWFCLKDIIQGIPNSSNKDITFPQPKKQASLKAWAICEWTEWPQFQFSMSQLSEILQSKSFLDLAFIQSKASMAFWSQNFQNGSSEKRKEKRLKVWKWQLWKLEAIKIKATQNEILVSRNSIFWEISI